MQILVVAEKTKKHLSLWKKTKEMVVTFSTNIVSTK